MAQRPFDAEWVELGKIDYLLAELARAVERGEVHHGSYEMLAPRYLARRAALVATITGQPVPDSTTVPLVGTSTAVDTWPPPAAVSPGSPATRQPRPAHERRERKPVEWTTVLIFLGSFLVVVASAIFAIAVWDLLGATGKLVFLGSLTAGFFAAGWAARTRLKSTAGATALTAVASAMLLFDGWIAIDGYNLEGPLPWAVLLLACSAVYWFIEVRLADRFFGVIGAAAQMGWWWLLGAGLGLTVPVRLAGMAAIALLWQLAAERGRGDKTVGSLATVLEWAAPIASAALAVGIVADLALVGSAGVTEAVCAAVVSACGAAVLVRTPLLDKQPSRGTAALIQLPFFAAVGMAAATTGHSWGLAAVLGLAALTYGAFALADDAVSFAVLTALAEAAFWFEFLKVLEANDHVIIAVLAAVAASWALASRMADGLATRDDTPPGTRTLALVAEWAAFALLIVCSFAVPFVTAGVPLTGVTITGADTALAAAVFAAWCATLSVRERDAALLGVAVYSLYLVASLEAWLAPELDAAWYALGLVLLAGAWLLAARWLQNWFSRLFVRVLAWADRLLLLLIVFIGSALSADMAGSVPDTLPIAVLLGVAALVFAADDALDRKPASAGAFGFLGVLAVGVAALDGRTEAAAVLALAASVAAVVIALGARAVYGSRPLSARVAAVSVAATSTALGFTAWGHPGGHAVALLLVAVAWAAGLWLGMPLTAFPAALALMGAAAAACAWAGVGTWTTVAVESVLALALSAVTLAEPFGPGGRWRVQGASSAVAAMVGVGALAAVGIFELYGPADASWVGFGTHEQAVLVAVLGAIALVQALRWDFEPGIYAGLGLLLAASWIELDTFAGAPEELFTTSLALYLVACGWIFVRREPERTYPVALDIASVGVGLGLPLAWALMAASGDALAHVGWVFGLSLVAITAGVAGKVRAYFFGGVAALALVAVYRAFTVFAEYWWFFLGILGVVIIIVALTWEHQRSTRDRLRASFEGWR